MLRSSSFASFHHLCAVRGMATTVEKQISETNFGSDVFRNKSFSELCRGLVILKMCTYPAFAKNAENFYSLGSKTIGRSLTNFVLRKTFFNHFVAGETKETLHKECEKMLQNGNMKVMLCPPMEDLGTDREHCKERIKENVRRYMEFVDIAIELNKTQRGQQALVQFKPTAVFPNSIMETDSKNAERNNISMAETVTKYAKIMNGATDSSVNPIVVEGLKATQKMYEKAAKSNIPIIVDGELRSTYFSLHALTMAASLLYNSPKSDHTYVYGTFQCYLKDTPKYFDLSVDVSNELNFRLGAKFVRGAYMEVERRLAKKEVISVIRALHIFSSLVALTLS
uniref:Proline dehydrogenase n=1 Tax=Plectus sambesii TaxID=2011161 RepID=A0A914WII7_9BILA